MQHILKQLRLEVPEQLYGKDPMSSGLGRTLVREGIELLNACGLEQFTFKKLAARCQCTEAAVYRYFENKFYFLHYLHSWYWGFQEHCLVLHLTNMDDFTQKIELIVAHLAEGPNFTDNDFVDIGALHALVHKEFMRSLLLQQAGEYAERGAFDAYFRLVQRIQLILEAQSPPVFKLHTQRLAITLVDGVLLQSNLNSKFPLEATASDIKEYFKALIFTTLSHEN
ncbi:MAG: TetR family transcriptional regulator [Nitritalea sp.]